MTVSAISATMELDARGLSCPLPILKTRKQLKAMQTGAVLKVISTDPGSENDMAAFCTQTGHGLVSSEKQGPDYIFHIRVS